MSEGKAKGWYLSFHCRKQIATLRGFCHGACLSRWKKDADGDSPGTFKSLVYQRLQILEIMHPSPYIGICPPKLLVS